MRSTSFSAQLLLAFFFPLLFTSSISAQPESLECPYFNIFSDSAEGIDFALVSTDVTATVSGVIANVLIEQTYVNSGDSIVDATYVFPMSSNAAVYGMEMQINQRVIKAVIKRKDEAQTIFDTANENGNTATLLEQHRPNVFQMSIANVAAGDSLRVRMKYVELLVPEKSIYQFVFPTIVAPRFTTNGEAWNSRVILDQERLANTSLNFDLKINAGTPLEASCKSHQADFEYQGNSAHTTLSTRPEKDFIVDFTLDDNEIETGLMLYEGGEENFFLSMIQPAKPGNSFSQPPREYIFIMDVSGSMRGEPIEVSKRMISNLLSDLNSKDKFNIIFFSGGNTVLSDESLAVTDENIEYAIDFISSINAGGSTQLLPAMDRAINMIGTKDYSRTFVIISDGHVTVEKEAFEMIRNNLNEANFFSFGIGNSVNRYIIDGLAYVGEASSFVATDYEDADVMADRFKEYIEFPTLTNITTEFSGIEVYDIEPLTIPDLFAEKPVIIYGKYKKPAAGYMTLRGDNGGSTVESVLDFQDYTENIEENIAIKYLWARKKIKLMSDYGIASNESDTISIEEEITQLGLKYSLVTEFTSFVAVDSILIETTTGNEGDGDPSIVDVEELDEESGIEKLIYFSVIGIVKSTEGTLRIITNDNHQIKNADLKFVVSDLSGKQINTIHKKMGQNPYLDLELGIIQEGMYVLSLYTDGKLLSSEKFIVGQ